MPSPRYCGPEPCIRGIPVNRGVRLDVRNLFAGVHRDGWYGGRRPYQRVWCDSPALSHRPYCRVVAMMAANIAMPASTKPIPTTQLSNAG